MTPVPWCPCQLAMHDLDGALLKCQQRQALSKGQKSIPNPFPVGMVCCYCWFLDCRPPAEFHPAVNSGCQEILL